MKRYHLIFCIIIIYIFVNLFICASFLFAQEDNSVDDLSSGTQNQKDKENSDNDSQWITLENGLEFCEFKINEDDSKIVVLRIEPEFFEFFLGMKSKDGGDAKTLKQWATDYDLIAAINASMYLPDNSTSTGYMRYGEHINNPRIVDRFGAFFLASPKRADLPAAMILEKDRADWKEIVNQYDLVVQNYRMTNAQRRILWSEEGAWYSISAIGHDGKGRILFLHSQRPIEAYEFARRVLNLPLDVRTIMYVEGGGQAGLVIRSHLIKRDLGGSNMASFLITGNIKTKLPNIIGIRSKHSPPKINK